MKMNELKPKLFDVLKDYSKEQAMRDVISGIIVAIIALPLSIALAIASGVGPEQGLYTAIIAGFFISFFGGSRCSHHLWHCHGLWHGRPYCRNHSCRHFSDRNGNLPLWFSH